MCLRNIFKTYSDNKENPKKRHNHTKEQNTKDLHGLTMSLLAEYC